MDLQHKKIHKKGKKGSERIGKQIPIIPRKETVTPTEDFYEKPPPKPSISESDKYVDIDIFKNQPKDSNAVSSDNKQSIDITISTDDYYEKPPPKPSISNGEYIPPDEEKDAKPPARPSVYADGMDLQRLHEIIINNPEIDNIETNKHNETRPLSAKPLPPLPKNKKITRKDKTTQLTEMETPAPSTPAENLATG